ncbi:MAG: hypothetical protein K9M51_00025 [Candidatus Gracilibacteria bacterium]|nr:hypothetical protein [Candidatus Gracilibacteria bacterium]
MSRILWGRDFGPLAVGRALLRQNPAQELVFQVCQTGRPPSESWHEANIWSSGLERVLRSHTRFGRVGVVFSRENKEAAATFSTLQKEKQQALPAKGRLGESAPKVSLFPVSLLRMMAHEGMADTVEFRRLARKLFRQIKHEHLEVVFFIEAIFAEESTQKLLQKIAGTQLKCCFVTDVLSEDISAPASKQSLKISTGEDPAFTHRRAEEILRMKLSDSVIESAEK